jgi:predicted transcriptional regulator
VRSPSRVTVVPDDQAVIRVSDVRSMQADGLSVSEIAARLGLSPSYVSRILAGERVK